MVDFTIELSLISKSYTNECYYHSFQKRGITDFTRVFNHYFIHSFHNCELSSQHRNPFGRKLGVQVKQVMKTINCWFGSVVWWDSQTKNPLRLSLSPFRYGIRAKKKISTHRGLDTKHKKAPLDPQHHFCSEKYQFVATFNPSIVLPPVFHGYKLTTNWRFILNPFQKTVGFSKKTRLQIFMMFLYTSRQGLEALDKKKRRSFSCRKW